MSARILARTLCILVVAAFIVLSANVSAAPPAQEVEEGMTDTAVTPQSLTPFGPARVMDIYSGANNGISSNPTFAAIGNVVYFAGTDGTNGIELWRSDGTMRSTYMVQDIVTGSGSSAPQDLIVVGTKVFFTAYDSTNGRELWVSNGKPEGTHLVANLNGTNADSNIANLTRMGTYLYFSGSDATHTRSLWKTDGITVTLVKDTYPGYANAVSNITRAGTLLYFTAQESGGAWGLWKSNGTPAGTVRLKNFPSQPLNLAAFGTSLYFQAYDGNQNVDGAHGIEPWKSNGTVAGTVLLKDLNPVGHSIPFGFTPVGTTVYFFANDGVNNALYKTNGTATGTVQLKTFASGLFIATAMGGKLYFIADDGTGLALWKSSGTAATTALIHYFSGFSSMVPFGGYLYMNAGDANGYELWRSNGTPGGTVMLGDVVPGGGSGNPQSLTPVGTRLWMAMGEPISGWEPWVYIP